MEFTTGDLVRLKSGGPLMTVEKVGKPASTEEEAVWCAWFEREANRQVAKRDTFPPATLVRASTPSVVATQAG